MTMCRNCGELLTVTFCDLGMSPLANSYVEPAALDDPEIFYPLHVYVCETCLLVQLPTVTSAASIFSDYAYFSSVSTSWLDHARRYTAEMIGRFGFDATSQVIEIASNDGYLLQYFVERGVPVLGIEPAANVAETAVAKGVPTRVDFFGTEVARDLVAGGRRADLLLGNNVLAHVPDLNDFVAGMKTLLAEDGLITMEFPHLGKLIEFNQFDTIYHEHFSYFSLLTVSAVFLKHGLRLFDVEELPTHGGSLRIFATHVESAAHPRTDRVDALEAVERGQGLDSLEGHADYGAQVGRTKRALLRFLIDAKETGAVVVGYGAPAKGNTLLNYCGVGPDLLEYTVDQSPHKQGRWLPGTRIPILTPETIAESRPNFVLILPWNLREEITRDMAHIRDWGGKFVIPIPEVEILD